MTVRAASRPTGCLFCRHTNGKIYRVTEALSEIPEESLETMRNRVNCPVGVPEKMLCEAVRRHKTKAAL